MMLLSHPISIYDHIYYVRLYLNIVGISNARDLERLHSRLCDTSKASGHTSHIYMLQITVLASHVGIDSLLIIYVENIFVIDRPFARILLRIL